MEQLNRVINEPAETQQCIDVAEHNVSFLQPTRHGYHQMPCKHRHLDEWKPRLRVVHCMFALTLENLVGADIGWTNPPALQAPSCLVSRVVAAHWVIDSMID